MLAKFIVRAIFGAIGLWLSSMLVAGVSFTDMGSLILAAVLLGLVNAVLRPILFILTLPLTFLTLGLFLLVLNAPGRADPRRRPAFRDHPPGGFGSGLRAQAPGRGGRLSGVRTPSPS